MSCPFGWSLSCVDNTGVCDKAVSPYRVLVGIFLLFEPGEIVLHCVTPDLCLRDNVWKRYSKLSHFQCYGLRSVLLCPLVGTAEVDLCCPIGFC